MITGKFTENCDFYLFGLIMAWHELMWHRGVAVITTAQPDSSKSELKFCTGSNLAPGV